MKLNIQLFASGSIEFDNWSSNSVIRGKIDWSSTPVGNNDAEKSSNNKSIVTANIFARRTSGSTSGKSWNGDVQIAGQFFEYDEIYSGISTTIGTQWVLVAYFSKEVAHEQDGSKNIYIGGEVIGPSGTSLAGKSSWGGAYVDLDRIPRASTPTFSSEPTELNQSVTITTNRVVNTYTHNITYTIGETTGTIATSIGDTTTWTPPLSLASEITTSTTGICTITTETYSGESLIGTTNVNLTLEVPSSVVPSVTIGTITEADSTMIAKNWGIFLQNKSKLNIPITATGVYGSTIQSIVTTINGLNFTGTPVVTPVLTTTGTNTITTTITDSRGYTATDTKTYSVVAYSNPNIQIAQVQRCLSDGTLSDNGTYLLYDFKGSISPASNNNTAQYRLGYKLASASTYTYVNLSTSYDIDLADQVSTFTISADYPYDVIFEAIDSFTTSSIDRNIDTGFDLLNFNASGKSMAIGKVSEASANEELLEVALTTSFLQDIETQDIDAVDITANSGTFTTEVNTADLNATNISATNAEFDALSIDNTNILVPYVLYNDSTGSNSSVPLNDSSANYTYITIFYRSNDNYYSSVSVYEPNNKNVSLISHYNNNSDRVYIKASNASISGSTITLNNNVEWQSTGSVYNTSNIYITRVIGYK